MVGTGRMTYQWHIFLASLDPTKGSEQAGKRPILVVSREAINQLLPVQYCPSYVTQGIFRKILKPLTTEMPSEFREQA